MNGKKLTERKNKTRFGGSWFYDVGRLSVSAVSAMSVVLWPKSLTSIEARVDCFSHYLGNRSCEPPVLKTSRQP